MGLLILGSSLTFSAQGGGWGKEKYLAAAKNPVRPREGAAGGGGGGGGRGGFRSAALRSRAPQKNVLILLEEKIGRAQI